jgi:hypothetical protein
MQPHLLFFYEKRRLLFLRKCYYMLTILLGYLQCRCDLFHSLLSKMMRIYYQHHGGSRISITKWVMVPNNINQH